MYPVPKLLQAMVALLKEACTCTVMLELLAVELTYT